VRTSLPELPLADPAIIATFIAGAAAAWRPGDWRTPAAGLVWNCGRPGCPSDWGAPAPGRWKAPA